MFSNLHPSSQLSKSLSTRSEEFQLKQWESQLVDSKKLLTLMSKRYKIKLLRLKEDHQLKRKKLNEDQVSGKAILHMKLFQSFN